MKTIQDRNLIPGTMNVCDWNVQSFHLGAMLLKVKVILVHQMSQKDNLIDKKSNSHIYFNPTCKQCGLVSGVMLCLILHMLVTVCKYQGHSEGDIMGTSQEDQYFSTIFNIFCQSWSNIIFKSTINVNSEDFILNDHAILTLTSPGHVLCIHR